jgi:hypothetical protein
MQLAEYESERDNEELVALIVADIQDPITPIFEGALIGEGLHDARRVIARLSEVVHCGAVVIDEHLLRIGTVKIDLRHVQPPLNRARGREISALPPFSTTRQQKRKR